MNISGVILRARPACLEAVREGITAIPGVEIQADPSDGRILLTVEDNPACSTADAFIRLHQIPGVLGLSLAYQYCDDELHEGDLQ